MLHNSTLCLKKLQTKTQITLNDDSNLIISAIKYNFFIFDTNQVIEFLVAKGSGAYLNELNLTLQDLKEVETSRQQIRNGQSTKANLCLLLNFPTLSKSNTKNSRKITK